MAAAQDDVRNMRDIEQFYNTQIEEMPMNVADLVTIPPSPSPSILNRGSGGDLFRAKERKFDCMAVQCEVALQNLFLSMAGARSCSRGFPRRGLGRVALGTVPAFP